MAYSRFLNYGLPYCKFGTYESYKDLGLILTSYDIGYPKRKTVMIDTNYTQGSVDVTDTIYSTATYTNRTIKLNFECDENRALFTTIKDNIASKIHGKSMDVSIIDASSGLNATYVGRVSLDRFKTDKRRGIIAITVDAKPFQKGTSKL